MNKLVFLLLALSGYAYPGSEPPRVEPGIAEKNLIKRVKPDVPAFAKALQVGGTVILDITISEEGKVVSTRVISGDPMLRTAFRNAVQQWEYKPFVLGGRAAQVVTRVQWAFEAPRYSSSEARAIKDYYPAFDVCYRLVRVGQNTEAEGKCKEAVSLSDQLPSERLIERSNARTFLAHSFFGDHRIAESIPLYEQALEFRKNVEDSDSDADFASDNANLARAFYTSGDLDRADSLYGKSVSIFEAAIKALPDMKANYTSRLKRTLQEYAAVKKAEAQPEQAAQLEQKAASLVGY